MSGFARPGLVRRRSTDRCVIPRSARRLDPPSAEIAQQAVAQAGITPWTVPSAPPRRSRRAAADVDGLLDDVQLASRSAACVSLCSERLARSATSCTRRSQLSISPNAVRFQGFHAAAPVVAADDHVADLSTSTAHAAPTGSSDPSGRRRWRVAVDEQLPGRRPTIPLAGTRPSEHPIQRYWRRCRDSRSKNLGRARMPSDHLRLFVKS